MQRRFIGPFLPGCLLLVSCGTGSADHSATPSSAGAAGAAHVGSAGAATSGGSSGVGGNSSAGAGGIAGRDAGSTGQSAAGSSGVCATATDCPLPTTQPVGCAEAECRAGVCFYLAKDADVDGQRTKFCRDATQLVTIETGKDCADGDKTVFPAAWDGPAGEGHSASCDGIDQDCSGTVDDALLSDGTSCVCKPGALDNCSETSSGVAITWPTGMPLGQCAYGAKKCIIDTATGAGKWDKCVGAIAPKPELCGGGDEDCKGDGDAHANDQLTWVFDNDDDMHGDPTVVSVSACPATSSGTQPNCADCPKPATCQAATLGDNCDLHSTSWKIGIARDDCDDSSATVSPVALEICDGLDNDCNSSVDENAQDAPVWSYDVDGDNFRLAGSIALTSCTAPTTAPSLCLAGCSASTCATVCPITGWKAAKAALSPNDCNDQRQDINPGTGSDPCDGIDNDCDGLIDPGCKCTNGAMQNCGLTSASFDGVGICHHGSQTCSSGSWGACVGAQAPEAEVCGTDDRDCDGTVGDNDPDATNRPKWACDGDNDGHLPKTGAILAQQCPTPTSGCAGQWLTNPALVTFDDCNDNDPLVFPGAAERCNRLDDSCDKGGGAEPDEDNDGDGYTAISYLGCTGGFPKTDCYDLNADVHPNQTAWFDRPFCRSYSLCQFPAGDWYCSCSATGCPVIGVTCQPSSGGDWDYDCSGTVEHYDSGGLASSQCTNDKCALVGTQFPNTGACGTTQPVFFCVGTVANRCAMAGPSTTATQVVKCH